MRTPDAMRKPRARPVAEGGGREPRLAAPIQSNGTIHVSWGINVDKDVSTKDSWEWETGEAEKRRKYLIDENVVPVNLEDWSV